jgi:pyridoxal phosphate enzyme (YggS family)
VSLETIKRNLEQIRPTIPAGVQLVAACKMRTPAEIQAAVDSGIEILGENYIQEAEEAYYKISGSVKWHFIGHLQRNKVARAVKICDMIESLDSIRLAQVLDSACAKASVKMECLIEINSGKEKNKHGVLPEDVEEFAGKVSSLENLSIKGLMTMGPLVGSSEDFRPYFKTTYRLFNQLKDINIPGIRMEYLSMGMSASYKVAIEEGANIVRIGTSIFGSRTKE